MLKSIENFYNQDLSRESKAIFSLLLLTFTLGIAYQLVNAFGYQYPGFSYLPWRWVWLSPFVAVLWAFSIKMQAEAPRLALFTESYTTYFFIALAFAVLTNGIQYTPFPLIDTYLLHVDQAIGLSTPALIKWTWLHPMVKHVLVSVYNFLELEVLLIPLLLPWFNQRWRVYRYYLAMVVSFLIGATIYYLMPTAAPVSLIHSPYFIQDTYIVAQKFFQIHHYLAHAGLEGRGGMIAFPSFHIVWAALICYALHDKKRWFYPLLMINSMVILSTLLLGWHYVLDLIAGFTVAGIAMLIATKQVKKHQA